MRTVRAFVAEALELERYMRNIGDPSASTKCWQPDFSTNNTYRFGFVRSFVASTFGTVVFGLGESGRRRMNGVLVLKILTPDSRPGFGAMHATLW